MNLATFAAKSAFRNGAVTRLAVSSSSSFSTKTTTTMAKSTIRTTRTANNYSRIFPVSRAGRVRNRNRNRNRVRNRQMSSNHGVGSKRGSPSTVSSSSQSSSSSRIRSCRGRKQSKPCSSKQQHQQQQQQQQQQHQQSHSHSQRRRKATLAGRSGKTPASTSSSSKNKFGALFQKLVLPNSKTWSRESINAWLNKPRQLPLARWISPRMITFQYSECFGHASFILVAVSYATDDFFQLRLMAIAGSTAMLVFTYFHPHGRILWLPFRWNCVFVLLNSWRVANVFLERYRSNQLSDELKAIYDHHFHAVLEKADFARLVRSGTLEVYQQDDLVLHQNEDNRCVRLVVKGDLAVDRDGQVTYFLNEGRFLSEMGLHAGLGLRGTVTSCCNVKAASPTVMLLSWDRTELMHLLELHATIERALEAVLSWDIVSKLKSQRVLLASGHIHDAERWTVKRREQSLARYRAILKNMLAHPGYLNARKDKLARYREIHQVSDADHSSALETIGWTHSEFEAGTKEGQLDEDVLERERLGFKWWVNSWWNAL